MKALELDSSLAEAHTSLALVKTAYDWDYPAAETEFGRAIALNPGYATAHHWFSHYLAIRGRFNEALNQIQQAHDLDPYSMPINSFMGQVFYYSRDYTRALAQFRSMLGLDPVSKFEGIDQLALVYEQQGDYTHALEQRRNLFELAGAKQDADALAFAYGVGGVKGYWRKRIEIARGDSSFSPLDLAKLYAHEGDKDAAFESLERAFQGHSPWLNFINCDPAFDSFRSDPRFQDLLRRMNLL